MSFLTFYVGKNRFAINSLDVYRIIPKVLLEQVSSTNRCMIGMLNLGDEFIPIIDFCQLIEQRNTLSLLNSRIILIENSIPGENLKHKIGILGEKVGEIISIEPEKLKKQDLSIPIFPYVDKVCSDEKGIIHCLNVKKIIRDFFEVIGK